MFVTFALVGFVFICFDYVSCCFRVNFWLVIVVFAVCPGCVVLFVYLFVVLFGMFGGLLVFNSVVIL